MEGRRWSRLDRWDRCYLAVSVAVVLFVTGYVVNGRRSGDVYWHVGAIESFADAPWSPANPMVGTEDPDADLSPYLLVLGLVSRITGLSGFDVLDLAGLVLVATFLWLFARAVRILSGEPSAPVLALVFTLTLWGIGPWRWSGYLSFNSIGFMTGYPSMAAWCALLGAVIVADRLSRDPSWRWTALLAVTVSFVALTHPITLVGLAPLVAGVVLRRPTARAFPHLAVASVVTVVVVLVWPYYPVVELLETGGAYDDANRATYRAVGERTLFALPALAVLVWRLRRGWRDPLVLTGAVGAAVFGLGHVTERWTGGRALPFLLLAAHVALADAVARQLRTWSAGPAVPVRRSRVLAGALSLLVVTGAVGSVPGIAAGVPRALLPADLADDERLRSEMDRYDPAAAHLGPGDVVVTAGVSLDRAVAATGAASVAPGYPAPFVDDIAERRSDVARFLYGDPGERAVIIERYGVTHVLVAGPFDVGTEVVVTDRYRLYALE